MKTEKSWPFPRHFPLDESDEFIKEEAGDIQVLYVFNKYNTKAGGFTIAYRYANGYESSKMIELAVSHCSVGDTFSKKTGREMAVSNFSNGKTIMVPANAQRDREEMHNYLKDMFSRVE